ncbi:MAG: NYN domain-containing protein [Chloroflexota bacterium]|nr:NYN domain-containing protein [Dehalococcoidia bacterium]MDW8252814.1 NYN domain-containing protein [Chloroflexota bacterium]
MVSQNGRVVLLIDYDNFEICVRRDLQTIADLSPVVAYAQTLGTVVAARAYGSWDDPNVRMMVYRTGVEPAFAPVFQPALGQQGSGKSVADTALVADGVDLLHLLRPDVLVVVSSDKDLMPLVRMARLRGAHVVVVGSDYTAAQLAQSADRLVTYRELVGGPRRRGVPMPAGQTPLSGALQPAYRPQPTAPGAASDAMEDAGVPPAVVPPVAAAPVTEPSSAEAPAPSSSKRRRRRRRGSRSETPRTEESAPDAVAPQMDLAEAINEAGIVDEASAGTLAPLPLPQRSEPAAASAPQPGRRLPFRRPEVLAQLESRRQPEEAVQPRPRPLPSSSTPRRPPAPEAEPLVEPSPPILEGVRREEPPIGPIRAAATSSRATEPEETAGVVSEPSEEEIEVVRPPLESLLGRVIVHAEEEPTAAEAALAHLAEESGGVDPGVAMIAADLEEQYGRDRRRRSEMGDAETGAPLPIEAAEPRPAPDPLTILFEAEGAPEAFREAAEQAAAAAKPRSRRRRAERVPPAETPPATDPDTADLTPNAPPASAEAPPGSDPDTNDLTPEPLPASLEAPPRTDPDSAEITELIETAPAAAPSPARRSGRRRR